MATLDLFDVRTRLLEYTGRADLSTTRLNDFINSGQRYLDMRQETPKSRMRFQKDIVSGDIKVEFEGCMAIEEVWLSSSSSIAELTKLTYEEMRHLFPTTVGDDTLGTPTHWCPYPVGLAPIQQSLTSSNFSSTFSFDDEDISFGTGHLFRRAIIVRPPADATYTIKIIGQFFSKTLSTDTDVSYWTFNYPDLLAKAAAYTMESVVRNSEGMRDWLFAIDLELKGIDSILVKEEVAQAVRMRG